MEDKCLSRYHFKFHWHNTRYLIPNQNYIPPAKVPLNVAQNKTGLLYANGLDLPDDCHLLNRSPVLGLLELICAGVACHDCDAF